jgi:hypothetical protein
VTTALHYRGPSRTLAAGTTTQPALLGIAAAGVASMVAVAVHSALLEEELVADD